MDAGERITMAAVAPSIAMPSSWRRTVGEIAASSRTVREGWKDVREASAVVTTVRAVVKDASPALWRSVLSSAANVSVTVIFVVVPSDRANAVIGRAVHRGEANAALTTSLGFRHRADVAARSAALSQCESDVAAGAALVRPTVFVQVRSTRDEAVADVRAVTQSLRRHGARVARGYWTQATWYAAQLPGAPSGKHS
jgi:hypothetical protein